MLLFEIGERGYIAAASLSFCGNEGSQYQSQE
jgi:hypothetical protein